MTSRSRFVPCGWLVGGVAMILALPVSAQQPPSIRPSVYQTTLEEPGQKTSEITTEELQQILATNSEPVFDVRTAKEYAIAHIPGTINIYEKEVDQIAAYFTDRSAARMVLYCNGPSCGKSKRTSEQLLALGFSDKNVRRYQLGLPVWRALGQTVQTDMPGVDYIYRGDGTAVFVDARTPAEYTAGTVPGAVNIQKGEATAANDDGRLPFTDKGTRVVIFANTPDAARVVAAEIAKKAYWNSSYFGGSFADLLASGYINHPPVAIGRSVTVAAGVACTATISPGTVDGGSYDPDNGDPLTLSVDPTGPLGLGVHNISLIARDSHGASSTTLSIVTVADQTGPVISNLAVDRSILWPPTHRMYLVTIDYAAVDNCGSALAELMVSSSEPGHGDSNDATFPAWQIVDAHHVLLRAARDGRRERTYQITVVATDDAGNRSERSVSVRVPGAGEEP